MKEKKWICAVMAVLLSVSALLGCQKEETTLQLKEEAAEKTVLTFFLPIDYKSYTESIYKDVIAGYNLQSDTVEIRVDGISTADGFNEALLQRLEGGGTGADLFIVNADSVKELNNKEFFYDLSELSAYDMLNETAKEQSVVDGTVYTIPLQMTAYGLYVNVGLLEQHGLKPPENLDEFLHCCAVLKENGITPLSINRGYAMTCLAMSKGLYPLYQSEQRDQIITELNHGNIRISDYMLDGFAFFTELVQKGYYGDEITMQGVDNIKAGTTDLDDFIAGRTAFAVFTINMVSTIAQAAPEMEFIQQGFPVLPDGTVSMPAIADRLCVNAKGPHVEEALKAVEYMTATMAEKLNVSEDDVLSAIQNEHSPVIDEHFARLYEDTLRPGQIPIEDMSLRFTYWDNVRELCLQIVGGMTPEEAAEAYDRIQEEQIRAYESN